MKTLIQKSRLQQLAERRNGYLVLALGLLILCLLLTIVNLRLINREKIIITPPVIHQAFWLDHDQVSPEYLSEMTNFLVQLRLTVTPSSASWQRETLLRYTDAQFYGAFKTELVAEADHMTQSHITLVFYPVNMTVEAKTLQVTVLGDLITTVGNTPLPAERVHYQLTYRYINGRLWLQSFSELSGKHHG